MSFPSVFLCEPLRASASNGLPVRVGAPEATSTRPVTWIKTLTPRASL